MEFVKRWVRAGSRTRDQMEQAGRSGKQNIAEGYAMQSLESYIKLVGVAHGSMKELAADYEDYIRQNDYKTWNKDDSRVRKIRDFRAVWVKDNLPNTPSLPNDPEQAANMLLTFCQMETYLLNKQIESLKTKLISEGGFRENLFKQRMDYKRNG